MSKSNPLGLIANYGDSDDELEDGPSTTSKRDNMKGIGYPGYEVVPNNQPTSTPAGIHPAPITHCPWSACYDENSGFTYYWNQQTNAVTWEAPPEYLLALKLAQQQLHISGTTEVSAEEWQLYQQALVDKQNSHSKVIVKPKSIIKPDKNGKDKYNKNKKRPVSDDEDEKIELITSYHNSDSESNDESEKHPKQPSPKSNKVAKNPQKKQKTKPQMEFGPPLPPKQNYSMPIGPELPPGLIKPKSPEKVENNKEEDAKSVKSTDDDSQDELMLLKRLKDKAMLLEKLGGELPSEIQRIIKDGSNASSPKDTNVDVDDLLEEIEKKEFKVKAKSKLDDRSNTNSITSSPKGDKTPPLEELRSLYPINGPSLFPSAVNIDESKLEVKQDIPNEKEKKENVYLMDSHEHFENVNRKKLRISNSVLPERKKEKTELPKYTTKYSQFIEGLSSERTGLGFSKDDESETSPKNTINYGNGLTFTKGEVLNEEKKDEDLDDLTELVEAKLKFLNQLQPYSLTPLQEMLVQMQTLVSAFRAGALHASYWRRWAAHAAGALLAHEAGAAPPGWRCEFNRSEGRYCYRRESDGLVQHEYPAVADTDMDISTTPPHPSSDVKEESNPQPTPSPPRWWRATPPPPGTDADPDPPPPAAHESKAEIGDELLSFYNDIAQLEQQTPATPPPPPENPRPPLPTSRPPLPTSRPPHLTPRPPPPPEIKEISVEGDTKETSKANKKKSKVKLSASLGMKHKSVSSLVAKWQQVAEEIHSD